MQWFLIFLQVQFLKQFFFQNFFGIFSVCAYPAPHPHPKAKYEKLSQRVLIRALLRVLIWVLFWFLDLLCLCSPSLVGASDLHPPDARVIFLHDYLQCNGMCSVTGAQNVLGITNGKDPLCFTASRGIWKDPYYFSSF